MRLGLLFAIVVLLTTPASGYGARVGQQTGRDPLSGDFSYLSYWGDTESVEVNELSVRLDGSTYLFTDDGAEVEADFGCSQEADNVARCDLLFGHHEVEVITWSGDDRVEIGPLQDPMRIWSGDGDDFVTSDNPTAAYYAVPFDDIDGGPGDDRLFGGPGADRISGNKFGDDFCVSRPDCGGSETIDGRAGDDVVEDGDGIDGTPIDRDVLGGGPGRDTLNYNARHAGSVRASLDPASRTQGESEDDITGIEILIGTREDDRLAGDAGANKLIGNLGSDFVLGASGADHLLGADGVDYVSGGPGADFVSGGPSDDRVRGGSGRDQLGGGAGDDVLRGGPGDDIVRGGNDRDRFHAGNGDDRLNSNDNFSERVYCGGGNDKVVADAGDRLMGCEDVRR